MTLFLRIYTCVSICFIEIRLSYSLRLALLDTSPATPWLPCAKGSVSQRLTEGLYGVSLNFSEKKFNESLRKDYTGKTPAARRAADCRFLSSLACGSFHLVSVFHKGKKGITSDALFADLYLRFDLFYRNPAFLSPPSRSARHLPLP